MTKQELIEQLSLHNDIEGGTKAAAKRVLEFIFETITNELSEGRHVDISGFGKFAASTQSPRSGINALTGKPFNSPAKQVAKFKASAQLKRTVAGA